jgi:hypothetical protein
MEYQKKLISFQEREVCKRFFFLILKFRDRATIVTNTTKKFVLQACKEKKQFLNSVLNQNN